jgi:hypothetical protein
MKPCAHASQSSIVKTVAPAQHPRIFAGTGASVNHLNVIRAGINYKFGGF